MSSIMNDLEKIQVATSHMLVDWLRQSFSGIALLFVLIRPTGVSRWSGLTVFRSCWCPPCASAAASDAPLAARRRGGRDEPDPAGTISGQQVVKSFGNETWNSNVFRLAAHRLKTSNLRYVAQQASPLP